MMVKISMIIVYFKVVLDCNSSNGWVLLFYLKFTAFYFIYLKKNIIIKFHYYFFFYRSFMAEMTIYVKQLGRSKLSN